MWLKPLAMSVLSKNLFSLCYPLEQLVKNLIFQGLIWRWYVTRVFAMDIPVGFVFVFCQQVVEIPGGLQVFQTFNMDFPVKALTILKRGICLHSTIHITMWINTLNLPQNFHSEHSGINLWFSLFFFFSSLGMAFLRCVLGEIFRKCSYKSCNILGFFLAFTENLCNNLQAYSRSLKFGKIDTRSFVALKRCSFIA